MEDEYIQLEDNAWMAGFLRGFVQGLLLGVLFTGFLAIIVTSNPCL